MKQHLLYLLVMLMAAVLACSDSGDNPVPPEDLPAISVQDQSVPEGNTALITVSLDHSADHRVVYSFASLPGTAASGSDFTGVSGSDTIPAGQTGAMVMVNTLDDSEVESSESFSLALSAVSGAEVARSLATCTITDNDVGEVSFDTQVRPLLQTSCAKLGFCHGSASTPGGGLYLGSTVTHAIVIAATGNNTGGLVVQAGSSSASTLYTKTTETPPFPSRMPQDGPPYLSDSLQHLIRDWIDQGAQDN